MLPPACRDKTVQLDDQQLFFLFYYTLSKMDPVLILHARLKIIYCTCFGVHGSATIHMLVSFSSTMCERACDFCSSTYFVLSKPVCLQICACIDVFMSVNLLLMPGRYNSIRVVLQGRIAFLRTKQSTSCPLYKQTGYSNQYGYQTHPTVVCVYVCVCLNTCLKVRARRRRGD